MLWSNTPIWFRQQDWPRKPGSKWTVCVKAYVSMCVVFSIHLFMPGWESELVVGALWVSPEGQHAILAEEQWKWDLWKWHNLVLSTLECKLISKGRASPSDSAPPPPPVSKSLSLPVKLLLFGLSCSLKFMENVNQTAAFRRSEGDQGRFGKLCVVVYPIVTRVDKRCFYIFFARVLLQRNGINKLH